MVGPGMVVVAVAAAVSFAGGTGVITSRILALAIGPTPLLTLFAGAPTGTGLQADGDARAAALDTPADLAYDSKGNRLLIAQLSSDSRLRAVDALPPQKHLALYDQLNSTASRKALDPLLAGLCADLLARG